MNSKEKMNENDIIYHILIDRFSSHKEDIEDKEFKKNVFVGGTLRGIKEKIPYIKSLGSTIIWISPFYESKSYHGYDVTDFESINKNFGNEKDLKELIDAAHKNSMKIIADFVPNHVSSSHPFFIEAKKNKKSKYRNWFYFKKNGDYLSFLSFKSLPKLNLENKEVASYICKIAKKYLDLGLDGYRIDHTVGIKKNFWRKFKKDIDDRYNNKKILIAEVWDLNISFKELETVKIPNKLLKWISKPDLDVFFREYRLIFDGILDFKFHQIITEKIAYNTNYNYPKLKREIIDKLQKRYLGYPKNFKLISFIDNHDLDRFYFLTKENKKKQIEAFRLCLENKQPTIIFYGDESGLKQEKTKETPEEWDTHIRKPMNWKNIDKEILNSYKEEIKKINNNTFK